MPNKENTLYLLFVVGILSEETYRFDREFIYIYNCYNIAIYLRQFPRAHVHGRIYILDRSRSVRPRCDQQSVSVVKPDTSVSEIA